MRIGERSFQALYPKFGHKLIKADLTCMYSPLILHIHNSFRTSKLMGLKSNQINPAASYGKALF